MKSRRINVSHYGGPDALQMVETQAHALIGRGGVTVKLVLVNTTPA